AIFMPGVWLWRLYTGGEQSSTIGRVARNSLAPIILNLFNRGIDFAFALVMLRILGPEDAGIYFYAGFIFVWFDIFTNFGLDLLLTREVARDRSRAARYFFSTSALRLGLTLIGVALLAGFLLARQSLIEPPLSSAGLIAIVLLYIGLFPGSLSKGMTSLFYAFEQAEYPAAITTISTISKTLLGLVVLVLGYGVIGLAGASIITNIFTLAILLWGGRRLLASPTGTISSVARESQLQAGGRIIDWPLLRGMVGQSWPLMLNHFLATIFFQIDVLIIEALHGARMVGLYSVAYKWLAALNIIPAFFTQAMLPVMSRQAHEDRDALKRTYVLAIKLLLMVALPVAVLFTFLAEFLTRILGGSQYLPDGAIATQLMIWSIPFGWINSLTQYVLVALDLQRRITTAFVLAVSFNFITNLIFVPQYGYQAAALTTIASEFMLLLPFGLLLHGALGRIDWPEMVWRPAAAAVVMLAVMAIVWNLQPLMAVAAGLLTYPAVLLALRPLTAAEIERLQPLLPGRIQRLVLRFS
ncbi:MAG TPA: flippase, partial [Spirillospora sp.]|nr:flippase [Spirillospora sp.]